MQPYDDNPPPAVPPDIEARLRGLSQPGPNDDTYLIPPPPARTGPGIGAVGSRAVETGGRVADAGLAAVSHFAIFFGFLGVGFLLSVGINVGIWLYSRRSPFVAYHAQQAGCYQAFVFVFNLALAVLLGVFLAGQIYWGWNWAGGAAACVVVVFIAWFPLSILYGLWGGLMVLLGRDFRYPYFGRTTRKF